jgi:hypothetical protein
MRSVLAFGLLITLCASANAATMHRTLHPHPRQHVIVPGERMAPPRFAVPGWTNEETRSWLDNASAGWSQA